jgi:Domain of unknown function (DUF4203)
MSIMNSAFLSVAIGILLLVLGRKLFWLVVAVLGFVAGFEWVPLFFHDESKVVIFSVALAMGVLGAVLAVFVQYFAVGVAGFLAGTHLATVFSSLLNLESNTYFWLFALIGGAVGAILALMLLDWALIILSSLVGASLVCQALVVEQGMAVLVFVVLAAVGILIQSRLDRHAAVTA